MLSNSRKAETTSGAIDAPSIRKAQNPPLGLEVTVVIPVYDGGEKFRLCLDALAACDPAPKELVVVADGESDGSWRMAKQYDAKIVELPNSGGPSRARNMGAENATGDIILFIDADVAVPKEAIATVITAFQNAPEIAALFGSYDDAPFEPNFLSQYKNLFHHYIHQNSSEKASTFWSGCGAIRRTVFDAIGGFDENYGTPSIEDIELGYRLIEAGYEIRLVKALTAKHLKRWGTISLVKSDFFSRALPWTDLLLTRGKFINDLNLKHSGRISVALSGLIVIAVGSGLVFPPALVIATVPATALLYINRGLYQFLWGKRGLLFTLRSIPWHFLYFLYSGLAFSIGFARHKTTKGLQNQ
jgi:GT2 family glycosyltransferase